MIRLLLLLLIFSAPIAAFSQTESDTLVASKDKWIVKKNDGTIYVGYLLKNDAREILIRTATIGDVYIPKHEVKSIEKYDESVGYITGEPRNMMASKYLQTTSAIPVKKGEGYAKFMPIGIDYNFALTDNWSLGGLHTWTGFPCAVQTKYAKKVGEKLYLGAGLTYGNVVFGGLFSGGGGFDQGAGAAYANLTLGTEDNNFNFMAGYGLVHDRSLVFMPVFDEFGNYLYDEIFTQTSLNSYGLVSFAMTRRMADQALFIFDSALMIGENDVSFLLSPAVRYTPKQVNIFQFGLSMGVFDGDLIGFPIPMLSYTRVFAK